MSRSSHLAQEGEKGGQKNTHERGHSGEKLCMASGILFVCLFVLQTTFGTPQEGRTTDVAEAAQLWGQEMNGGFNEHEDLVWLTARGKVKENRGKILEEEAGPVLRRASKQQTRSWG